MIKFKFSVLIIMITFFSSSCTDNPKSDQAEVSEAREVTPIGDATKHTIDKQNSDVTWVGTRPGKRHNGTIGIKQGNLQVANNTLVGGTIVLDMQDIEVLDLEGEDKQKLTGHLKSPDFFDSEGSPEARFEITSVEVIDGNTNTASAAIQSDNEFQLANPTHKVSGNLTMREKTLGITFPARIDTNSDEIKAEAKFNIDRTQWGVSYQDEAKAVDKAKDKFIYNTVNVGFNIVAQK
ncbi:MAG: YceI family protein [Bacteroidota bacterium]|jgi:polyisoprenoid-binding protein YceI|nr:YceI family protein [Bacteroidota bacterium]